MRAGCPWLYFRRIKKNATIARTIPPIANNMVLLPASKAAVWGVGADCEGDAGFPLTMGASVVTVLAPAFRKPVRLLSQEGGDVVTLPLGLTLTVPVSAWSCQD